MTSKTTLKTATTAMKTMTTANVRGMTLPLSCQSSSSVNVNVVNVCDDRQCPFSCLTFPYRHSHRRHRRNHSGDGEGGTIFDVSQPSYTLVTFLPLRPWWWSQWSWWWWPPSSSTEASTGTLQVQTAYRIISKSVSASAKASSFSVVSASVQ